MHGISDLQAAGLGVVAQHPVSPTTNNITLGGSIRRLQVPASEQHLQRCGRSLPSLATSTRDRSHNAVTTSLIVIVDEHYAREVPSIGVGCTGGDTTAQYLSVIWPGEKRDILSVRSERNT